MDLARGETFLRGGFDLRARSRASLAFCFFAARSFFDSSLARLASRFAVVRLVGGGGNPGHPVTDLRPSSRSRRLWPLSIARPLAVKGQTGIARGREVIIPCFFK